MVIPCIKAAPFDTRSWEILENIQEGIHARLLQSFQSIQHGQKNRLDHDNLF